MDNKLRLSVVVPTYNEELNVDSLVWQIHDALKSKGVIYEIIFIDDHSSDATVEKIKTLSKKFPVSVYLKEGEKGKAFSLRQGFDLAKYENFCMIDADLQYPPSAIPEMLEKLQTADIVVANRKKHNTNFARRFLSRGFRSLFGKMIFGLKTDIQSGLKLFKAEVWKDLKYNPREAWAFDLEFLYRANSLGFKIKNHDIIFNPREKGISKVTFFQTVKEIGLNALKTRFKPVHPVNILDSKSKSMAGAGMRYKKTKYLTHTTLHHSASALKTFHYNHIIILSFAGLWILMGLYFNPLFTLLAVIAVLSFVYFIDVIFNLYLVWRSLNYSKEITYNEKELKEINDKDLPVYTILCPLYKEAHVLPQFVKAISRLKWPKEKLDIILLFEEDDATSIEFAKHLKLPKYFRVVVVPDSQPKTKPKACNYGLAFAKGEYLVIYDAEDLPDPMQLKKAFLGFKKVGKDTICLQAKLNYYNPNHNLLTRFFTAEYSLWFDVSLTGLQSLNTSIPLGGTSNHFRAADLRSLEGWDPFNVTEDADLGVRLFRKGFKTAIIDSTTFEEANSKVKNWLRQRSRWIKGYMQTYLVHTRDLFDFSKNVSPHSFYFNLTIGGKIAFILINPILWVATIAYFTLNSYVGETIEYLYPSYVFYMAAFSLIFGNFLFVYYYMVGAIKREQWGLIKYIFLVPFYWLLISTAGYIALFQLIFKPHYWEKTVHGFHLRKAAVINANIKGIKTQKPLSTALPDLPQWDKELIGIRPNININGILEKARFYSKSFGKFRPLKTFYFSGSMLVGAIVAGNIFNFVFNAYLGRELDYNQFALVGLINSLQYFTTIPFMAIGAALSYRAGFLDSRYGQHTAYNFLAGMKKGLIATSFITGTIWLLATPYLMNFFKLTDYLPILLFTPIWLVGYLAAANKGFLTGKFMLFYTAAIILIEPVIKLAAAYALVSMDMKELVYVSIPVAVVGGFLLSTFFIVRTKPEKIDLLFEPRRFRFPSKFFVVAMLSGLSAMTFLSLDVVLAAHYLPSEDAGKYALISLVGKIIFFLSTMFAIFIMPMVSRNEGARKDSSDILWTSLGITFTLAAAGVIGVGVFGNYTVPALFGEKAQAIVPYLLPFTFAVGCFSISYIFASYYLAKKLYSFSVITFVLALTQIIMIYLIHASIYSIVMVMLFIGYTNLFLVTMMHLFIPNVLVFENNFKDFLGIFTNSTGDLSPDKKLRILILNWRDIRHKFAGGAEVYIHEIAKRFVQEGNSVTVFCGNDAHCPRYQVIDGVQIVRRGGFYTVYFWAFLYYVLKFRGKFDIVIDSENGIPFLTPFYIRKPIYLLIHHVHQEVFRNHLPIFLSKLARLIEGRLMPYLYKNKTVITVSDSSKKEIIKLGFTNEADIHVVHPGIDTKLFYASDKSEVPTVVYLGRIQPYKNLDVLVKAFANVLKSMPDAKLVIAGEGGAKSTIEKLAAKLNIAESVFFQGKVSEEAKIKILGRSWVSVQPSQVEGWGITVIEANACGTPVIASNVNGLRDSIVDGKTGLLVKMGDSEQFANAILNVLKDEKLRKTLSKEALAWSQNFVWDESAKTFYEVIINSSSLQYEYKFQAELA